MQLPLDASRHLDEVPGEGSWSRVQSFPAMLGTREAAEQLPVLCNE